MGGDLFCCEPLGAPEMAEIFYPQLIDGRSGATVLPCATRAGHFAALTLNRIRVSDSIFAPMWARIP